MSRGRRLTRPRFASAQGLQSLDRLAQRYGCRPSALAGEADPYRAYCLDEAAALAAALAAPHASEGADPALSGWLAGQAPAERRPATVRMVEGQPLIMGTIYRAE